MKRHPPELFIEEVRRNLVRSRKYLGLSQNKLADILGISPSTIEKFEQGLNMHPSTEFLKKYTTYNELCNLLKDQFEDRKFISRSVLSSPLSALGGISPLQFAKDNPEKGIFQIYGVLRRTYG